ncbi:MAG: hypothetical protein DRQ39_04415 [Gammaproteobacteria bacterium]|nr:MAG: hypothetical protein DRQ39_04415 [Gammaproteobacteria bacterium]
MPYGKLETWFAIAVIILAGWYMRAWGSLPMPDMLQVVAIVMIGLCVYPTYKWMQKIFTKE